jgi:hypothetical protein
MGVTMRDPKTISLNLYNSSQTCSNLKSTKCAVINLTSDIEVFYKTAFKEANPYGKLPQEWFGKAEAVNSAKLRSADATVEVSVVDAVEGAEKTTFTCKIEQLNAAKMYPQVYCRALSATLEAILHSTRVKLFINQKTKQKEVSELLDLIENSKGIVFRAAPNSKYSFVMEDLLMRIDGWRNKP